MALHLLASSTLVGVGDQAIAILLGGYREVEGMDLQAVLGQLQLPNHLRPQQADDVGEDRVLEARVDLLGDGCAADQVAPLQNQHLASGFGEIGRTGQAVVASADDDGIIFLSHSISRPTLECVTEAAEAGPRVPGPLRSILSFAADRRTAS